MLLTSYNLRSVNDYYGNIFLPYGRKLNENKNHDNKYIEQKDKSVKQLGMPLH
jgi:hypothetical protein